MKKITQLLVVISVFFTQQTMAQYGLLDLTFADGGVNTSVGQYPQNSEATATVVQPNGRILVAGTLGGSQLVVARFKSNGILDSTFGTNGTFKYSNAYTTSANAIALQKDKKIVIGGRFGGDLLVMRLDTSGAPDNTFGTNGLTTTDIMGNNDVVNAIAIQSDGKIVAAGSENTHNCVIARYTASGTLDVTFNTTGWATPGLTNSTPYYGATSLVIQADQKIILGGSLTLSSDNSLNGFLFRLNADGSFDTNYGAGGFVLNSFTNDQVDLKAIALQTDGKLVVVANVNNNTGDFGLFRLNTDGTADASFGSGGGFLTDLNSSSSDYAYALSIQKDGKIVASGLTYGGGWGGAQPDFALVRYNSNGSLDNTFGTGGIVKTNISNQANYIKASAIQSNGRIIVAGTSDFLFTVARYIAGTDLSGVDDVNASIPSYMVYPNPVGSSAHLEYELAGAENISIQLLDVQGKLISQPVEHQNQQPGKHELNIDFDKQLPAGIYLLRIFSENGVQATVKVIKD